MAKSHCYYCEPINMMVEPVADKWRGTCKVHGKDVLRYVLPKKSLPTKRSAASQALSQLEFNFGGADTTPPANH